MIILTSILTLCLALQVSCSDPTYVVYPNDGTKTDQTKAIAEQLKGFAKPDAIYTSSTKSFGVNFWTLPLTGDQLKKVQSNKNVASVNLRCNKDCYDPTTALVRQNLATDEMVFISQQANHDLAWYNHNYIYDDTAGEDIEVYIIDTGADIAHSEFTSGANIAHKARWIFVEKDWDGHEPKNDVLQHGTCMLSKAAGHQYGAAKNIKPVIVRAPTRTGPGSITQRPENYLEGVSKVLDDVGNGKKAILSMSWYYPRKVEGRWMFPDPNDDSKDGSDGFRVRLRVLIEKLISKGVYPITGSGNNGRDSIDGWPANFGKANDARNYIPQLIVVGATDNQGNRWMNAGRGTGTNIDAAGGLPHVWAPGANIECASPGNPPYRSTSGTSLCKTPIPSVPLQQGKSLVLKIHNTATATTAGLAAYFLKLGEDHMSGVDVGTPQKMKDYIIGEAWARQNSMKAIWNGVNAGLVGDHGSSCPIRRRDVDSKDPGYKKCTGLPMAASTMTTSAKPSKTQDSHQYSCTPYPGDRNQQQCSCNPTDCKVGEGNCLALIGVKGQGGCDDNCKGCHF